MSIGRPEVVPALKGYAPGAGPHQSGAVRDRSLAGGTRKESQARRRPRRRAPRAAWARRLAGADTAALERHAGTEFAEVKSQAKSADGLTAEQPAAGRPAIPGGHRAALGPRRPTRTEENRGKAAPLIARLEDALRRGNAAVSPADVARTGSIDSLRSAYGQACGEGRRAALGRDVGGFGRRRAAGPWS